MNKKQILLINDMAGYGKVATAAMLPILSYMGLPTYNLPTALVSNTLDYGKFNILDTTDYIQGVFPVWKELGFSFDAIATGFIASERQAEIVSAYCKQEAAHGTTIFVDPIMGDEGKLNHTEACYLTGSEYHAEGVSKQAARTLLDKLHATGAKSVLITSIPVEGQHCVAGYNDQLKEYFLLPYTEIPVHFPGTGDIFSAVLIGNLLNGKALRLATRIAMDAVYRLIDLNKNNADKNRGIPLENYLNVLDE